jgi:hypothetical protein
MPIPYSLQNLSEGTLQLFREIVQVPRTFDSSKEEEDCRSVVQALTDEEVQETAEISYAYWVLHKLNDAVVSPEITQKMALKVASWHVQYVGSNNAKKATEHLKDALKLRKDLQLELFRTCFDPDAESSDEKSIRADVQFDMEHQLQVLHGVDKEGRAVVVKMPRQTGGTTEQAYIRDQLYVSERSAAVTEYISRGQHDTVCAIFNMQNQNSNVTPPLAWQLHTIKLLQSLAPGRMEKVVVLDAPFLMRGLFSAMTPFLSASLKESTFLVTGMAKTELLEQTLVSPNILSADGTLVELVDIEKYLCETPFHLPYNYKE